MKIKVNKPVEVEVGTISVHAKIRDGGSYELTSQEGSVLHTHEGYVPSFFPGDHYGDYLELEIDVKTGKIVNWPEIGPEEIQTWMSETMEEE